MARRASAEADGSLAKAGGSLVIQRAPGRIGPIRFFALSFGCIVGSGWVVVLGDWLRPCGPAGVVIGMCAGGSVMLANSGAYAELIARYPQIGGEFVFAQRIFGLRVAFLVGWLSTLSLLAVVAFEATALPMILEALIPAVRGPILYHSLGSPVTADAIVTGWAGTLLVAFMNYRGIRAAATMQTVLSFVFLGLAVLIVALGFALGSPANLHPLLSGHGGRPWWVGSLWIFATVPLFLNGFQSVAQAIEERGNTVTLARVAPLMVYALLIGMGFYCLVTLAASAAQPWRSLVDRPMATAAAFDALLPHHLLSVLVLAAAALSVARVWNGVTLWVTRVLMAQARAGLLPARMGIAHPRSGSSTVTVMSVAACTALGPLLGKGVLIPLVDTASVCLAGILVVAAVAALRARAKYGTADLPYATPGGTGTLLYSLIGSAGMAIFAFLDPVLRRPDRLPPEWMMLGIWACAGLVFWRLYASARVKASSHSRAEGNDPCALHR